MEAEFIAASQAGREILGLKELFAKLDIKIVKRMPMWMGNQAVIKQLEGEKSTTSAKHVDIRFKFICQHAQEKMVKPSFTKSSDMIVDLLTKALPVPRIQDLREMFNLKAMEDAVEEDC